MVAELLHPLCLRVCLGGYGLGVLRGLLIAQIELGGLQGLLCLIAMDMEIVGSILSVYGGSV